MSVVRRRGRAWGGAAIALAWSLLAGCGTVSAAENAEDVSIYGPVDDYLLEPCATLNAESGGHPRGAEPRGRERPRKHAGG